MFRKFSVALCCVRGKHVLRKHTHSFKITPQGLTHGAPTLIHTNPQHLNDVVVSRDYITQSLFILGDQSLLCTHTPQPLWGPRIRAPLQLEPSREPHLHLDCTSAQGWSLNIYHAHRLFHVPVREKKTVWGSQHYVLSAVSLLSSDIYPQITKIL